MGRTPEFLVFLGGTSGTERTAEALLADSREHSDGSPQTPSFTFGDLRLGGGHAQAHVLGTASVPAPALRRWLGPECRLRSAVTPTPRQPEKLLDLPQDPVCMVLFHMPEGPFGVLGRADS